MLGKEESNEEEVGGERGSWLSLAPVLHTIGKTPTEFNLGTGMVAATPLCPGTSQAREDPVQL